MREQTTVSQSKKKSKLSIPIASKTTKVRPKVPCNCKKCNGKWTESRTREKHYAKEEKLRLAMEEPDKKKRKDSTATVKNRSVNNESFPVDDNQIIDHEYYSMDDEQQYHTNTESMYDARHARHQFINPTEVDQQYSDEDFLPIDDETLLDDDEALNMNDVMNKQFSAPDFDDTVETSNTQ
ncbi:unnamed protein product [Rhizophagus irregularis]|nr:unnamed protein product [Rhizophagus irregularis]CAB5354426.1 unnamed protein product [Rhizophagus irregularis]CAB5359514.1 unnamed protein product [Rhizophagus irregularis]CAB5386744.1 unnamed protein product [Rhizophagus irregularis]